MKVQNILLKLVAAAVFTAAAIGIHAQNNIAEEVAWMIGDVPIYKSEIEAAIMEMQQERIPIAGDPYCVIPEQLAIERLFLHQADLDTVEVSPSTVQAQVDARINYLIANLGSKEKVEQYFGKNIAQLRDQYARVVTDQYRVQMVRESLTKDVKATPAEVRRYYSSLDPDSIPMVPLKVEVQIIAIKPVIPQQEIDDVKARLRDYADRVNNGEADFSTLAILYSEAPEGMRGGEIGFMGRGQLVPEYAAVAFNLNDPKKVSKIVETEYGFHIIQLIEKRGDRVNTRHILLRPKVSEKDLTDALTRLDSVRVDMVDREKFTFEEAARYISQDKDTRNSDGVMVNPEDNTTKFQMSELPTEIALHVSRMQPGEVSRPFIMKDPRRNQEQVVMVKLTSRTDAHRANLSDDFQLLKNMCEAQRKADILTKWLDTKIRNTYIRIEDGWRGCDFEHEGWIKR